MTPLRPDAEILRYISATPALLSLLYDIDLLPEQNKPGTRGRAVMAAIAEAWKANDEAMKPNTILSDAKPDPPQSGYCIKSRDTYFDSTVP